MRKVVLVIALSIVGFTATAQKIELKLKNKHSLEVKNIKISNRLMNDLKEYGKVSTLRAVFTYDDGKVTMIKRRGNTTKRGNGYVYYRENVYFEQL